MGRPPCCDKVGIKKGPWTPEEDIVLVSYIQEHGPGNWRAVPTNTGLMRCSKSCRLRWTNYLRPGIKRGNFTPHEEGMIIHLQALLGNKWAAIATYLPQRTDNDIKNYWNTHLKKKLKKFQSANLGVVPQMASSSDHHHPFMFKNYGESQASIGPSHHRDNSSSSTYASSEENISRLLEGWMHSSSFHPFHAATTTATTTTTAAAANQDRLYREFGQIPGELTSGASTSVLIQSYRPQEIGGTDNESGTGNNKMAMSDDGDQMEAIWSIDHHQQQEEMNSSSLIIKCNNGGKSSCDSTSCQKGSEKSINGVVMIMDHEKERMIMNNTGSSSPHQLSFIEKWLLEDCGGQVDQGIMELPSIF